MMVFAEKRIRLAEKRALLSEKKIWLVEQENMQKEGKTSDPMVSCGKRGKIYKGFESFLFEFLFIKFYILYYIYLIIYIIILSIIIYMLQSIYCSQVFFLHKKQAFVYFLFFIL